MQKTAYPGYWSIDRRVAVGPIAVYRIPVLSVRTEVVDNKFVLNSYEYWVFKEDERKIAWMLGSQNGKPLGVVQFCSFRRCEGVDDLFAEMNFMLNVDTFNPEDYEEVFGPFTEEKIHEDFQVAVTASTKVLVDGDKIPRQNDEVAIKFNPVVIKNSKYVPITTNHEPKVQAVIKLD